MGEQTQRRKSFIKSQSQSWKLLRQWILWRTFSLNHYKPTTKESIEQEIHNRNSLYVKTIYLPKRRGSVALWEDQKSCGYFTLYLKLYIDHNRASRRIQRAIERGGDPKLSVKRLLSGSTSALLKMSPIWDGQFHWHRANARAICGLKVTFNWRISPSK